jgi:REP element-mobilizing transposase RayT
MSLGKPKFDPQKHHRRSIRLKRYDYSSEGAYYVTIVTQGRECVFGTIADGEMRLNEYGEIVQKWWNKIPSHFPTVGLGVFVIMPNHVHGIIFITTERRGEVVSPLTTQITISRTRMLIKPLTWAGKPCPYANGHWDKLLRISNTNPPKR